MDAAARPGDWICASCTHMNFACRQACQRCSSPRPDANGNVATNPTQVPKAGDWYCGNVACSNLNFAKRTVCNKCGSPQPGFASGYAAGLAAAGGGQAQLTGYMTAQHSQPALNYASQSQVVQQPYAVSQAQPSSPGGNLLNPIAPGDWKCARCANVNFARRTQCNKCQVPKEGNTTNDAQTVHPAGLGAAYSLPNPTGEAGKILAGDWFCPNADCNNMNFARRTHCNRCSMPKPAGGGGVGGGGGGGSVGASPY
eukprot:NODE_1444_length_913_cov_267.218750_g1115_i0.p1 GENE.NODE_1444_length_913_cov_267.218750_g1115_i0~~NODE_1444_length_913_cov_267.218750_g1115_i0.p1  ORF type:complete len:272 (+),score=52.27 NODE_1444_length_913_cov_267.218750_g1115_i0:52-816(+)